MDINAMRSMRYQALLDMSELIAHKGSLDELLREIRARLRRVLDFDSVNFSLHDDEKNVMHLNILEESDGTRMEAEWAVGDCGSGWVWQNQQPLLVSDLSQESRFPLTTKYLLDQGMRSLCMLPLGATERSGALGFASKRQGAYGSEDMDFLSGVAHLVALALDNSLTRQALREENDRLQVTLEISKILSSSLDFDRMFSAISQSLRRVMLLDYASVALPDPQSDQVSLYLLDPLPPGYDFRLSVSKQDSLSWPAMRDRQPKFYTSADLLASRSPFASPLIQQHVQSGWCIPLIAGAEVIGSLNVASKNENAFGTRELAVLNQIANQVAVALVQARAYKQIAELKNILAEEKLYLEHEIREEKNFEEIIGESKELKRALVDVKTVADSDATVLILGETGTGKELIARAVHRLSPRQSRSFIKLNCAAIPTGLLESELFGHEKGAFTGAIMQKVGRMELAHGGTLFLDEIGDIPLELQPKLLRVLQDREFERLGSTKTIKVNVRLVAATNRDLAKMVAERQFRSDLYYRLRVFPIPLAALRQRREDIPLLVRYFVQRYARRMTKRIESIGAGTMEMLTNWEWPGNIRELENFIERSVILTKGSTLQVPVSELRPVMETTIRREATLEAAEREHIMKILHETGGVISGTKGAAARLGLKRTTLQSKMQKLRISRQDYQN